MKRLKFTEIYIIQINCKQTTVSMKFMCSAPLCYDWTIFGEIKLVISLCFFKLYKMETCKKCRYHKDRNFAWIWPFFNTRVFPFNHREWLVLAHPLCKWIPCFVLTHVIDCFDNFIFEWVISDWLSFFTIVKHFFTYTWNIMQFIQSIKCYWLSKRNVKMSLG